MMNAQVRGIYNYRRSKKPTFLIFSDPNDTASKNLEILVKDYLCLHPNIFCVKVDWGDFLNKYYPTNGLTLYTIQLTYCCYVIGTINKPNFDELDNFVKESLEIIKKPKWENFINEKSKKLPLLGQTIYLKRFYVPRTSKLLTNEKDKFCLNEDNTHIENFSKTDQKLNSTFQNTRPLCKRSKLIDSDRKRLIKSEHKFEIDTEKGNKKILSKSLDLYKNKQSRNYALPQIQNSCKNPLEMNKITRYSLNIKKESTLFDTYNKSKNIKFFSPENLCNNINYNQSNTYTSSFEQGLIKENSKATKLSFNENMLKCKKDNYLNESNSENNTEIIRPIITQTDDTQALDLSISKK